MIEHKTDWEGLPVPENEQEDKLITIWVISPLDLDEADEIWCRSWDEMLAYVKDHVDTWLENYSPEELRNGVSLVFQIRKVPLSEYEEVVRRR